MSKVEERALEKYPYAEICREKYIEGYHQAEKDLELGWTDIKDILSIYEEVIGMDFCEDIYGEVLKRFKETKRIKS